MFTLGLELRLRQLAHAVSTAGLSMVVEVGLMLALGYAAGQALGWSTLASVFAGATVAISSTSIVVRVFREQGITGRLRETVFGILVFEDFAVILLIALLTAAASGHKLSGGDFASLATRLGILLTLFLALGMLLVPRAVRAVAGLKREETLVVSVVGICFGLAWLAQAAGFSVALGAFLAGVLAAESGLARIVEHQVQPLRDMFAAIFFVAVGMQLNPAVIAASWPVILGFVALVLVGKAVGVALGVFLVGRGPREAVQAGLSLAQIGEFSFIIAGLGVTAGVVPDLLAAIAVAVSVITAFVSPVLIQRSDAIAAWVDRRLPRPVQTVASLYGAWVESLRSAEKGHSPLWRVRRAARWLAADAAVVAGLVVLGSLAHDWLADQASAFGVPAVAASWLVTALLVLLVAPFLFGIVRVARGIGLRLAAVAIPEPGPGRVDNGRAPRRTLAIALQFGIILIVGAPLVAITQPFIPGLAGLALLLSMLLLIGIAFWRTANDLLGHVRAGAELVVASLAKQSHSEEMPFERIRGLLPGLGDFVPAQVAPGSEADGKTLGELAIRGRTGATVVALLRGEERVVFPEAGARLSAGDYVALTGSHDAIEAATPLLKPGA